MSYPPILDIQSLNKAKDDCTLGTPGAAEAIKAALEVVCNIPDDIQRGHRLDDGSDVVEVALRATFVPQAVDPPPTPSVAPPKPLSSLGEAGTSNSQMPFTLFCTGTPISQPNSPHPEPTGISPELLNGEGPQAFFDLTKGQRVATLALKEKRRLAWKRNRASRQARQKATVDVANGKPQQSCKYCKQEFASCRAAKQHLCPFSKGESNESGEVSSKGKSRAAPKLNKLVPNTRDAPPAPPISTMTTIPPQAKKMQDQHPLKKKKKTSSTLKPQEPKPTTSTSGPWQSAETHFPHHTYSRALASDQPHEETSDCRSARLNTETKHRTRRGLLDKLQE
ncbi:hypothetical protein BGW80DRAFT_1247044 [Lactifluus volemus]|nr:hypothetical protein BGW80DRAFT_1247044 [Lactifluus volemus]